MHLRINVRALSPALAVLIVAGCDNLPGTAAVDPTVLAGRTSPSANHTKSLNLIGSDATTNGRRGGQTYRAYNSSRTHGRSSDTFEGYGCVNGCGAHVTGFHWARDEGITDAGQCGGDSWSFIEGCVAFASRVHIREGGDEDIERGL